MPPNALPYLGIRLPNQEITQRSLALNRRILDVFFYFFNSSALNGKIRISRDTQSQSRQLHNASTLNQQSNL